MPFKVAVFLRFFCKKNDALNGQVDFFVRIIHDTRGLTETIQHFKISKEAQK